MESGRQVPEKKESTLGAGSFSFLFCLYSFPGEKRNFLSRLRPTAEDVSPFVQHLKFPPHARKNSGTQGKRNSESVLDFFELKTELESLKGPRNDDEKNVIQISRLINDEIKDLNPQMSWMPKEDDLKPSRTTDYIPHLLDVFLTVLITGKSLDSESSSTEITISCKNSKKRVISFCCKGSL